MNRGVVVGVIAVIVAAAVAAIVTTGYLPETVATKFLSDGRPVDTMSRAAYAWLMGGLFVVLPPVVWLSLAWLPRRWPKLVNVPFRDYWLAPERRDATLERLAKLGAAAAVMTVAVLGVVHLEVLDAHRRVPPSANPWMAALTFAIVVAILVSVAAVAIRFRPPKDVPR